MNEHKPAIYAFKGTVYEIGYGMLAKYPMKDRTLGKGAKLVYAYLCAHAGSINPDNIEGERDAFPSQKTMMLDLDIKKDETLQRYVRELRKRGYVTVERKRINAGNPDGEGGRFKNNIYNIEAIVDNDMTTPQKKGGGDETPPQSDSDHTPKKGVPLKRGTISNTTSSINNNNKNLKTQNPNPKEAGNELRVDYDINDYINMLPTPILKKLSYMDINDPVEMCGLDVNELANYYMQNKDKVILDDIDYFQLDEDVRLKYWSVNELTQSLDWLFNEAEKPIEKSTYGYFHNMVQNRISRQVAKQNYIPVYNWNQK